MIAVLTSRITIFTFLLFAATAVANPPELKPAQTYSEIVFDRTPELSKVVKVTTAKVLAADYALIRKDFHQVKDLSDAEIDRWLLNQVGYISSQQVISGVHRKTNQAIFTKKTDVKTALRPPQYNRALVYEAQGGGLIDMKGAGSELPVLESHGNGLMETAEAIREHFFTKAVKDVLMDAKAPYGVVDSYAVIDWGFRLHDLKDGKTHRAGAILRQAHVRDYVSQKRSQGQLSNAKTKDVETYLRKYGITSAMKGKISAEVTLDALNVQGTKDERFLFDFGSYRVMDRFENKAVNLVDWGYGIDKRESARIFDPEKPDFIQPDPKKRLSYELWNGAGIDGDREKIWLKARELAEKLDRSKIQELLAEYRKLTPAVDVSGENCLLNVLRPITKKRRR